MDRRDFLLLRVAGPRETELSCERLYMRYVDAEANQTMRELFTLLRDDLAKTRSVRITHREWLAASELKREVEGILSDFGAAGGAVRYDSD
jgi:hypothetical protein